MNVMRVKTALLSPHLDRMLQIEYGLAPGPVQPPSAAVRAEAIKRLWDVTMAVSGEIKPGGVVNNGISPAGHVPYETHTIRQLETDTIAMLNPRRLSQGAVMAHTIDESSVIDTLLDPRKTSLTFNIGGEPLYKQLQAQAAVANGM
jgi:hypothetical protein